MKTWICKHREEMILSCSLMIVIAMFLFRFGGFASEVDWLGQHSVFPDYFRRLFYRTGKFFRLISGEGRIFIIFLIMDFLAL